MSIEIKELQDEIKQLKKEKHELLEALDFASIHAGGIGVAIKAGETNKAMKQVDELLVRILNATIKAHDENGPQL